MQVVLVMERFVDFLAEWCEIFRPSCACSEVGVFGIELEPIAFRQAMEHRVEHIVQFDGEATVDARMIDEPPGEGVVELLPI